MLKTDRLNIRWAKDSDSEYLFKNYTGDSRASKFLTRRAHNSVEQTHKFLKNWSRQERGESFALVISLRETDEPIGVLVFFFRASVAEIHFGIGVAYWGQGLSSEAICETIPWLREEKLILQIQTFCDVQNIASQRVLEKCGFEKKGKLLNWLELPAFGGSARDCYEYTLNLV